MRGRLAAPVVLAGAAVLALAACSSSASSPSPSSSTAPSAPSIAAEASAPAGDASPGVVEADAATEHVHNLALVGTDLYLGTHEGLFKQPVGAPMKRVSAEPFDVMGLTRSGDSWFASGHPGGQMGGPSNLGLITSTDDGVTWSLVSLSGEVDFHRLSASGGTIMGVSSHDGALRRSTDAGGTWTTLSAVPPFDLAVSPQDPLVVVGTTPDGPTLSRDGAETFTAIEGAPLIALLSWDGTELYGVDPSGQVLVSSDEGRTWATRGTVAAEPAAVTAQGGALAILAGGTVYYSTDGGQSFAPRITGLAGH